MFFSLLKTPTQIMGIFFALLVVIFLGLTPWDRILAEYVWVVLALSSIMFLIYFKFKQGEIKLPKELKTLNYIFISIPIISIASYLFTPLDNLSAELLEPDIRWLLFIPIITTAYILKIHPIWVVLAICTYVISAFSTSVIETDYLSKLYIRASGDENANPFGMYNSMITIMLFSIIPLYKQFSAKWQGYAYIAIIFICILMGVTATLLTGTRTAFFTLIAGFFVIALINIKSKANVGFILTGLMIIFILFLSFDKGRISTTIKQMPAHVENFFINGNSKSSTGQRLEQWRGSVCVFMKHPILGTGPRSARTAFGVYGDNGNCDLKLEVKPGPRQTHSMYFNTLLTLGTMGILVFSWLFIHLIKISRHYLQTATGKAGASMLIFYIVGMMVNGIGLDMWFRNYMVNKNLIALLLPLILIYSSQYKQITNNKVRYAEH